MSDKFYPKFKVGLALGLLSNVSEERLKKLRNLLAKRKCGFMVRSTSTGNWNISHLKPNDLRALKPINFYLNKMANAVTLANEMLT